jgi:hypothetical protein
VRLGRWGDPRRAALATAAASAAFPAVTASRGSPPSPGRSRRAPCTHQSHGRRSCAHAGVRVNRRDHAVLRDPSSRSGTRPSSPVSRSWPTTVANSSAGSRARPELPPVQHPQHRLRVPRQRVDELLPRLAVLPITHRLPRGPVVIIAASTDRSSAAQPGVRTRPAPRGSPNGST